MAQQSKIQSCGKAMANLYRICFFYAPIYLFFLTISQWTIACDSDNDCKTGETCFKREKRARGICYPSMSNSSPSRKEKKVEIKTVTGERRDRAVQWLGDPLEIIGENLPNRAIGKICIVTSDCPDGSECVLAGFEGRCVEF